MGQMFTRKEFPYLFTILIALIGWTVNHISNRLLDSKIISYSSKTYNKTYSGRIDEYKDSLFEVIEFSIKNLTQEQLFRNIHFTIMFPDTIKNGELKILKMRPDSPLYFNVEPYEEKVTGKYVSFKVDGLHPKTSIKLYVYFFGEKKPNIYLEYQDEPSINKEQPILFLKSGIDTKILEYEIHIFTILLIIWIMLVGFYLFKLKTINYET
ncbi:hypothetical protein [Maribellus maritimus]|uniref:hypothetical protein n=1 Tax=Maribellus maritimus TaxID=2870838 RepID=UPI001EEBFAFA|nr:hypothetical protein [Maribellus maritimus]MCG6186840.1 hypothetical protein [Maribellus maritimus]